MAPTPPGCPPAAESLVDVTHLPVAVRWLLAIVVVCTSGFFAGECVWGREGERERERREGRGPIHGHALRRLVVG